MQRFNFFWISVLIFLLKMDLAFGDVAPNYDEVFSLPKSAVLIECGEFLLGNSYCQNAVKSFNPQTGLPEAAKKITGFTVMGGEGYWYAPTYGQKKLDDKDGYFQVLAQDDTRIWVKAPLAQAKSIEKILTDLSGGQGPYEFNPDLNEVFLNKEGTATLAIGEILKLSSIFNKPLGSLQIILDPSEVRNPKSKKALTFTFPGKGERQLTSMEISAAIASKSPGKFELPVFRIRGSSYLVQIEPPNDGDDMAGKGVISDSVVAPKFYTWIKSNGVVFKYNVHIESSATKDTEPQSPSLKFHMERGETFQKSGSPWTSVKIYAMPLDFDALKHVDESGNEGYLSRKKTLLREIFFPVYNAQDHINFWLKWEPAC